MALLIFVLLWVSRAAQTSTQAPGQCQDSIYGCANVKLTDTARTMFLNYHNEARRRMAKGVEPNKQGLLPTGKNVYELNWDCQLEQQAQKWANQCKSYYLAPSTPQNYWYTYPTVSDPVGFSKSVLDVWWNSIKTVGLTDPNNRYTNGSLYAWTNMAHGRNTALGCAYNQCDGMWFMTCLYRKMGYYPKTIIYEKGPSCKVAADCTTYEGSSCRDGLCYQPPQPPVVETFFMCPGNTDISDQTRMAFLDTHNRYRSSLAKGLEPDGIAPGAFAPKAKQMTKMRYNCTVENYARKWNNQCLQYHSPAAQRPGLGETMYYWDSEDYGHTQIGETASTWFWDELRDVGLGYPMFTDNMTSRGEIRHYTQMAWEKSTELGCHVRVCPGKTSVVCQYGPAGNMYPNMVYIVGDPCTKDSDCPGTQTCSVKESLCILPYY